MLRLNTMVLRTAAPLARSGGGGSGWAAPFELGQVDLGDLLIERHLLSDKERRDNERDESVLLQVPVMELELPQPVQSPPPAPASANNWGLQAIGAEQTDLTGEGVTVAVLDTGIDQSHPAFRRFDFASGIARNFTLETDDDVKGHGTHCAGTILGEDCDGLRIGVARGVRKALFGKIIGKGGDTKDVFEAISWAAREGAHVISISAGLNFIKYCDDLENIYGLKRQYAVALALKVYRDNLRGFDDISRLLASSPALPMGCVVVAASGNESQRPAYAVSASPPAVADRFVAVGAVGRHESGTGFTLAPFSNEEVALVAPGVGIWSAKAGGGLRSLDGTSMAAPYVAGAAILWTELLLRKKAFSATAVIDRLKQSAINLDASFRPSEVGAGLVQVPRTAAA